MLIFIFFLSSIVGSLLEYLSTSLILDEYNSRVSHTRNNYRNETLRSGLTSCCSSIVQWPHVLLFIYCSSLCLNQIFFGWFNKLALYSNGINLICKKRWFHGHSLVKWHRFWLCFRDLWSCACFVLFHFIFYFYWKIHKKAKFYILFYNRFLILKIKTLNLWNYFNLKFMSISVILRSSEAEKNSKTVD